MPLEHEIDRLARIAQRRVIQLALGKHWREAGGAEQHIAIAQRYVEPFGQPQHHVARRLGFAGFDKTEMAGGDLRIQREIELAHATAKTPFAKLGSELCLCLHRLQASGPANRFP